MANSEGMDTLEPSSSAPLREQPLAQLFEAFRQNLQADFKEMISEFKADIQSLVSRTDHVEKKMAEFAKSHNTLLDSHSALEEEVARLSAKVVDLEDRSRRNNVRIRGIPESITPDSLATFLMDLMAAVLPSCNQLDLAIDRIHRIPKPKNLSAHSSRDVIARIHFFQTKDNFLRALRSNPQLPERFQHLSIYPDLSAATMLRRKEFSVYTKILRDHNIQYRWGFPVKLIVYKDGASVVCQDPAAVKDVLHRWNLLTTPTNSPPRKRATKPSAITPLWSDKQETGMPKGIDEQSWQVPWIPPPSVSLFQMCVYYEAINTGTLPLVTFCPTILFYR